MKTVKTRETKFRAWDVENKKWYQDYEVRILGNGSIWTDDLCHKNILHNNGGNGSSIIICLYTGLKDMNGKEIYEGDIVKQKPCMVDEECIGVASISPSQGVKFGAYPFSACPLEIIGNIYENEELLNEK